MPYHDGDPILASGAEEVSSATRTGEANCSFARVRALSSATGARHNVGVQHVAGHDNAPGQC